MTIYEYADIINACLVIKYRPSVNSDKFSVEFENYMTRINLIFLESNYGFGDSINESINNFIDNIKGKTIVNELEDKEYNVPNLEKEI